MSRNKPFRILLVEDNPSDIVLLRHAMSACSFPVSVDVVSDGDTAVEWLLCSKTARPDLIILDLNLPKIGGHEVLKIIKNDERTRCIPVVVMSSSESQCDINKAYEFHANSYVKKPSELEELYSVVKAIEAFWISAAALPAP